MEKIGNLIRQESEKHIRTNLQDADSFLVVGYSGLSGPDMGALRQNLNANQSRFFVVRNSLTKRVFNSVGLEGLSKMLEGPCGLIFVKNDIIATCKIINNFAKEHATFKIAGGILKDKVLNPSDIASMAALPSKKILYTKLAMNIQYPISSFVGVLHNTLRKLVIALDEIKKKKEK